MGRIGEAACIIARLTEMGGHFNRSTQHRPEIVLPATGSRASCEGVR